MDTVRIMTTAISRFIAEVGPHRGRMGGRFGHPGLFLIGLVLLLAAVAALMYLVIRGNRRQAASVSAASNVAPMASMASTPTGSAETILSERFARGEVSVEDFVAARAALRGERVDPTHATMPPAPPAI
jgi:uncharacterized membrane protein